MPAAFSVTVPPVTATPGPPAAIGWPSICVTRSGPPSVSLSLPSTSMNTGVSSVATKLSAAATGASFAGKTLPLTRAVAVAPLGSAAV